jgi:hypothetical protein
MSTYSVTERGTFKRCRRRWHYSAKSEGHLGLEPVLKSPAFVEGGLVHKTLAYWAENPSASLTDLLAKFEEYEHEEADKIMLHYINVVGVKPSPIELNSIFEAIAEAKALITRYVEYYKSPFPEGLRLITAEQTFTIDVPGTEHTVTDNGDRSTSRVECHKLEATLDGVLADEHDNLYVLEHKTYSRRPSSIELVHNDQFLAYMWVLRHLFNANVRGVAYNGLWKRTEIPKGKTINDMFLREILLRSEEELAEFTTQLAAELNEMASLDYEIHPERFYKNVPALGGCWDCSYRNLCTAQSRGEDLTYLLNNFTKRPDYYSQDEATLEAE